MASPLHNRQSTRLKGYDYSQEGLYFITMCCLDRKCLFGHITNGKMQMNDAGIMIDAQWQALPKRFPNIELHEYVVMPNHFHGIIQIVGAAVGAALVAARNNPPGNPVRAPLVGAPDNTENIVRAPLVGAPDNTDMDNTVGENNNRATTRVAPTPNKTIGDIMDAFKSITTVEYIRGVKNSGWPPFNGKIWQRNYHDHIIRNAQSYVNISEYILNNPAKWGDDKFYKK